MHTSSSYVRTVDERKKERCFKICCYVSASRCLGYENFLRVISKLGFRYLPVYFEYGPAPRRDFVGHRFINITQNTNLKLQKFLDKFLLMFVATQLFYEIVEINAFISKITSIRLLGVWNDENTLPSPRTVQGVNINILFKSTNKQPQVEQYNFFS